MNYESWRYEVFGQAEQADPATFDLSEEFEACSQDESLDHVDRVLVDNEVHDLFNKTQIGNGLQRIYSNCCSDLSYCYVETGDENRRLVAIANLRQLYENYFERYCSPTLNRVGSSLSDGPIGCICYMLWDIFVLRPNTASPKMIESTLDVMEAAINSGNESCIVSAIHGLGHWNDESPRAGDILRHWLRKPTTKSRLIRKYARQAKSGYIQ